MLDQDALVVAGDDDHLRDGAVEDRMGLGAAGDGEGDAVVERQLDVLVHRVVVLAVGLDDRALDRPGQAALVGGEVLGQGFVHGGGGGLPALGRRLAPGLGLRGGLADDGRDLAVQGLHLAVLLAELVLVLPAVLLEAGDQAGGLPFLAAEGVHVGLPLAAQGLRLLPEPREALFLELELRSRLLDALPLLRHVPGQAFQIAEAADGLADVLAGEDIHVPEPAVAVLVGAPHQAVIVEGKGVVTGLQAVDFLLADLHRIVQGADLAVALGDELLPGGDLPPHQREVRQRPARRAGVVLELAVDGGDLLLQLRLAGFLAAGVLRGRRRPQEEQPQDDRKETPHLPMALRRAATRWSRSGISPSVFFALAWLQYTCARSYSPRA